MQMKVYRDSPTKNAIILVVTVTVLLGGRWTEHIFSELVPGQHPKVYLHWRVGWNGEMFKTVFRGWRLGAGAMACAQEVLFQYLSVNICLFFIYIHILFLYVYTFFDRDDGMNIHHQLQLMLLWVKHPSVYPSMKGLWDLTHIRQMLVNYGN